MIDLYFNFYKKSFNKKLQGLLLDIEKLFSINNIEALQARNKYLDSIIYLLILEYQKLIKPSLFNC